MVPKDNGTVPSLYPGHLDNLDIEIVPARFVLHSLLGISITTINLFLQYVFLSTRTLRTVTSFIMSSLALADEAVGLTLLVPLVYPIFNHHLTRTHCDIIGYFFAVSFTISLFSILMLSADRMICILNPFHYTRICTRTVLILSLAGSWCLGLTFWIFPLFGFGSFYFEQDYLMCTFNWTEHPIQWMFYVIALFFTPTVVTGTCYYAIWRVCRHQARTIPPASLRSGQTTTLMSHFRKSTKPTQAIKTVLMIVGVFYCSWAPFMVVTVYEALRGPAHLLPSWLHITIHLLATTNSLWNPIIYISTNKRFREATMRILRNFRCCLNKNICLNTNHKVYVLREHTFKSRTQGPNLVCMSPRPK